MNTIRTVTVKKGNTMKVKEGQMIEDGKKKEDVMSEDKRDNV